MTDTDLPTIYEASITTPSGITITTTIVVPYGAEYDSQHELINTAATRVRHAVQELDLEGVVRPPAVRPDPWDRGPEHDPGDPF